MSDQVELAEALRAGMRRLASGVCVVSTSSEAVARCAMTVSSVTSVSMEPASLLVCINRETLTHQILSEGVDFCINVLAEDQVAVSNDCAGGQEGEARFDSGNWAMTAEGIPYLADAQAAFVCQQDEAWDYGTHRIYVGRIKQVKVNDSAIQPLIYLDGDYRRLAPG